MASLMPAVVMTVGAIGAAAGALLIAGAFGQPGLIRPVAGGMLGPLIAVVATWIVTVRTYRRDPAGVLGTLYKAFFAKAVFFTVYVVVMIKVAELPGRPFGLSFVAFFIGLYAFEAFHLARLSRQVPLGSL
jgi:hypothetical protein